MAKRSKSYRARKGTARRGAAERPCFVDSAPGASYACDVAIVGGGAAGLACAVACVQEAERLGASTPRIVIVEADRRVGASILRSGNGRCNFSNAALEVTRYHNAAFVERAFAQAEADPGLDSVLDWFEDLGLVWSELPGSGGLLYPFSRKADSVLAVLRRFLDEHAVAVEPDARVAGIEAGPVGHRLLVSLNERAAHEAARHKAVLDGAGVCEVVLEARVVVVAAGGTYDEGLFAGLGRTVPLVSRKPVLGPLAATAPEGASCEALDGIRMQVRASLPGRAFVEEGEVLFRPYGVSGIVVFNASRHAESGDVLRLDLAPDISQADLVALLERRRASLPQRRAEAFLEGFVLPPLSCELLRRAQVRPDAALDPAAVQRIAEAMKTFDLIVEGVADERACQVRRGGVAANAVDPVTFALAGAPGVHVVGEALDVDGPCGGYNLHWAWVSGRAAGVACAREIQEL